MRIAYICADGGIPVFGCKGASVHVQEVLRALLQQGAEITLFARRFGAPPPPDLKSITLVALSALPAGGAQAREEAALKSNDRLAEALKNAGPFDLVYERYSLWSFAGLACARQQGWPALLEVNAPLIEEQRQYRELVAEQRAKAVLQSLLASASAVIAVSPGVKDYLAAFSGSTERVHVIANGVDPQRFACCSSQNRDRPHSQKVVIGFLGTLKPWHGLETLMKAFQLLRKERPQTWLLIVGDGPQRKTLSEGFPSGNVVFTGGVEPSAVPGWLGEMDIAVAPYPEMAGFWFSPLKIYEYMAAKLPVITTRVGHLAEVVSEGETGLLIAPDDPVELCHALRKLTDDPGLRQRLGQAACQHVTENHSWQAVVQEILRIAQIAPAGKVR